MRGYHEDTMATTRRKLGESEFNKYFGHAYDSTGALSDNYKHSSFLSPWTNQVRDSVYDDERNVDLIKEVRQGMDSIIFNDKNVDKYSIEDMNRKGFRTIPFKDAQFALPGQAHEIVQHENNVYNNDLILDFGRDFGKNRYIATSADKPRFSGDSLIKETRKSQLSTLQSLKQSYDRETSVEEKAKIKDRILNTMQAYKEHEIKNITGKDGKAENLMKIRLENSFNGKASLLPIFRGEGYNGLNVTDRVAQLQKYNADILSKAKVDGKSILEHYAEGKYIDTQYMSEQGLRDMGYFDEKFMRNAFGKQAKGVNNKQLENMMKETMQTTGDIAMLQRFPVIMEKSGTPVRLLMDPRLQGDQTKLLTVTSYGNKADVDGDTVSTSMMKDKDGLTHLRYELATQNGEKVSDSLTKMAKGQEAAMIDHAINLNHSIENKVQDALAKDMENSIMDLSSLGQKNIIDKKLYGAINGVTNITYNDALGHVEKVKQYVEAAQAQLAEAGQKTTGATLHNKVTELIKLENPNNAKAVESLTRSYAISDAYNKLMKEKTSKLLKGAVGEMNLPNKRLREAYFLTANPANEKFVMNTSILQNVLNVTEEAAISAKKATSKVDEARISQWRSYLRNVQDGHDVRGNIGQMKSWLHENMEDDILKVVDDTAESSDVYRNIVKEFGSDKEQIVNHYIDSFGDIMKGMAGNNGIRYLQNGFFKFGENKNGITNAKDIIGLSVAAHDETMQGSMVKRLLKDNEIGHVLDRDMFDQTNTFNDTVRSTVADGREWLKDEPSAGQIAQKVLQSTGSVLEKLTSAFDGKTLAMGALGLAGAILVSGFVGGNPAAPAETQAQFQSEDDQQQQTYEEPSLFDYSRSSSQKQKGYVINVRGQTNRDIGHAKTAINNAVSSSMNTNVNVSMNITDATGNINDRYIEQLLAGALN
jgi:hypothetical protein